MYRKIKLSRFSDYYGTPPKIYNINILIINPINPFLLFNIIETFINVISTDNNDGKI